jgi:hypothetical protein
MDADDRSKIVNELGAAFGGAEDVSPDDTQPLHVLLPALVLQPPWTSPTRGLVRFTNWPSQKPELWVDEEVVNADGNPPRNPRTDLVLGEPWRGFSFDFPWNGTETATLAIQTWLVRFREAT